MVNPLVYGWLTFLFIRYVNGYMVCNWIQYLPKMVSNVLVGLLLDNSNIKSQVKSPESQALVGLCIFMSEPLSTQLKVKTHLTRGTLIMSNNLQFQRLCWYSQKFRNNLNLIIILKAISFGRQCSQLFSLIER